VPKLHIIAVVDVSFFWTLIAVTTDCRTATAYFLKSIQIA